MQSTSSTTAYSNTASLVRSGNLTINRNGTGARSITLGRLYVTGNLSITGPVNFTCTDLYVGGTLTIGNTRTTASTVTFGGPVYSVGAVSISGNLETNGTTLYGGSNITFTGLTTSTVKTHRYALVFANSTASTTTLSNNVQLYSSETSLNGNFTISGATTAVKNWLGHLYVLARPFASPSTGDINWSGTASVTSRDWQLPDEDPQPMWMGEYWSRTGVYSDEYGPTWVPGNSGTSIVFNSTGASSIMCPLLCTTEKNTWSGNVQYGDRGSTPMVFFFMCDNNGIYPQVCRVRGHGHVLRPHGDQRVDHRHHQRRVDQAVHPGRHLRRLPLRPDLHLGPLEERHRARGRLLRRLRRSTSSARSRPLRSRRPPW